MYEISRQNSKLLLRNGKILGDYLFAAYLRQKGWPKKWCDWPASRGCSVKVICAIKKLLTHITCYGTDIIWHSSSGPQHYHCLDCSGEWIKKHNLVRFWLYFAHVILGSGKKPKNISKCHVRLTGFPTPVAGTRNSGQSDMNIRHNATVRHNHCYEKPDNAIIQ